MLEPSERRAAPLAGPLPDQAQTGWAQTGWAQTGRAQTGQIETGQIETRQPPTGRLPTGRAQLHDAPRGPASPPGAEWPRGAAGTATPPADGPRSARLGDLLARIRAIETGGARRALGEGSLATFAALDGYLERGVLHEFCGPGDGPDWSPPLALLVALAQAALAAGPDGHAAFVGRRVWPHPAAFAARTVLAEEPADPSAGGGARLWLADLDAAQEQVRSARDERRSGAAAPLPPDARSSPAAAWLERLLLVDTRAGERGRATAGALLWAADRALRCSACRVVVVDGSGLTLAAVRRLQLAAEAGGALALLARPANDAREPSSAASRWSLARVPSSRNTPCWSLHALRRRSAALPGAAARPHGPRMQA